MRHARLLPIALCAGLCAALLLPPDVRSQNRGPRQDGEGSYQPPTHATAQDAALWWISGRFRMPVTCLRTDGSKVEIEEAVVFRANPSRGRSAIKATFFGIEGKDLERCYNLLDQDIPDRRGVLHLHFRAHTRLDYGLTDFRRLNRDGSLTYHISDGKLHVRPVGGDKEDTKLVDFGSGDHPLELSSITAGSDAHKLLIAYDSTEQPERARRRFSFRFQGPDDFAFSTHMIEDEKRWR